MKTLFKGKGKLVLTCLIALCAVVLACAVLLCCNLLNKENTTAKEDITTIEQIQTPDLNIKNTANIQLPDVTTSDGKAVFDIPYSANSQTVTLNQTVYSSIPGNLGYVLSRVEGPIETTGDEIWIYNGTSNKLMIAPGAPIGCYDVMFDMYDGTTEIGYSLFVIQIRDASVFSLSSATMTLSSTTYTYDGTEKKPYPTIKLNEYSSVSMGNYTVSYENNVDVGTATVTVTGSGYYTGSKSATFTISEADLSSATVELDPNFNSYAYDGAEKQPVVTVKLGKATISDANYTVSYENNIDVGTATVKIKSKGNNCIGETSITFNITLADISEAEISGVDETYTYTGAEIKPVPTVTLNDNVLAENTAYTLTYASNIELGTATITITGIGSYEGTATKTFVICQINIKDASISGLNEHYDYTGSAITPEITVTIGETVLVKDTDYTITYSSNTAKGTATITLTGTGNYEGTKTVTFIIDAKDLSTATITGVNDSYPYTGSAITPAITVTLDGLTLVKDTDYTVS